MKLSKFDIGAEIISILTKGMYPDPKDALREYIQNGVDARAKNISLKIRQESIVIEDDGTGMTHSVLRKAIRVGISDKNPAKDVGFMGIGIYSAFHLCNMLRIYSRPNGYQPNILTMDFGGMKSILERQRQLRLQGDIDTDELIDLQTILEECVSLTEDGDVNLSSFPTEGTRVELSSIEPEFYTALSDFDEVSTYLQSVIPLTFDRKFKFAEIIENKISEICAKHEQTFELINLKLQVNSKTETLFRPYKDIDFGRDGGPQPPIFHAIESGEEFFGVAWGCLNKARRKLDNRNLRGFILKKQGFSIGRRESLVKFFPRTTTFFDRYTGEVIIVNPKLLPNASRNDIEYSPLRSIFFDALADVADKFDDAGHTYQEHSKADEDLAQLHSDVKKEIGGYNEFEEDTDVLVGKIVRLKNFEDRLRNRIERKGFSEQSETKAVSLLEQVQHFQNSLQLRIKVLTDNKKKKQEDNAVSKVSLAKNVAEIDVNPTEPEKKYDSLYDLLIDLEYKVDPDLKEAIYAIDELFVQALAKSKANYYSLLNQLKDTVQGEN